MSSRPISYRPEMILAKLAGRKRVTRRLTGLEAINREPNAWRLAEVETTRAWFVRSTDRDQYVVRVPFQVGGIAWAQEAHRLGRWRAGSGGRASVICTYIADGQERIVELTHEENVKFIGRTSPTGRVMPGRFMYRSCSRIVERVVSVRPERLHSVTEEDARLEGVEYSPDPWTNGWKNYGHVEREAEMVSYWPTARESFISLWTNIHGTWNANPWVWRIEMEPVERSAA